MDVDLLTEFFMWCSIIAGGMYLFSVLWFMLLPDFTYALQTRWFPMPRETYNVVMFGFMGLFKVILIVFVIVPYVSLLIVA